jgi:hypothetical protein
MGSMTDMVSTEQADRLRAGLYDDEPVIPRQLRSAMLRTGHRSRQDAWKPVLAEIEALADSSTAINNQLRLRRRQVLSGRCRPRPGRLPRLAMAATAGIALVMAATFIRPPADPPAVRLTAAPAKAWREVPDLANNVDFYHWMENRSLVPADQTGT